ncbi:hypothetical protein EDD21DRAFT_358537 [Dissophora ornata]|nr:hypothetical protein EDD21DRAFT_358537 [Dissophora ornata]
MIVYSSHQHQRNPSTLSNFCQSMLRISSLHILQAAGYDAVQANPMSVLADCLGRYLEFLAESAKEFAQLSGRSQITAFDVVDGLSDLGIELSDLKVWLMENGGEAIVTPVSATGQSSHLVNGENTTTTPGTAAAVAGPNAANRPVLPSWKGVDPGRVVNDLLWNGRRRDTEHRNVYEWHAVPEGFIMPETEEDQDEFAYPEASDDEATENMGAQQEIAPTGRSKWIPESKPPYIPDYMPPFPGAAVVGDLLDAEDEDRSSEFRNSQSMDAFDRSMSMPPSSTADLLTATDSPVHSEMAKLSINTTQQAVVDSSMQSAAQSGEVAKQDDRFRLRLCTLQFRQSQPPNLVLWLHHGYLGQSQQDSLRDHSTCSRIRC